MPKRTRSGEVLIESSPAPKGNGQTTTAYAGTGCNQQRLGEGDVPCGILVVEPTAQQVQGTHAVDWAAEELLRTSPFWALLIRAGYTWW